MATTIYAIYDNVADQLVGGLQLHKHVASAVRAFSDIASDPQTLINRHPDDYDLIQLGFITPDNQIKPEYQIVMRGAAWAAAQTPAQIDNRIREAADSLANIKPLGAK